MFAILIPFLSLFNHTPSLSSRRWSGVLPTGASRVKSVAISLAKKWGTGWWKDTVGFVDDVNLPSRRCESEFRRRGRRHSVRGVR